MMALRILYYTDGSVAFEDGSENFTLLPAEVDRLIAGLAERGRIDVAGLYAEPVCQACGHALVSDLETGRPVCPNCCPNNNGVVIRNG